ncbi:cytochrome c6 PetJ [Almyronema epifaneia]|uniref:Cytochrome c6 n=1 Tax=Almyronema epifaneia S1 TaxID=2991925 RepID=A0ABW6IGP2_9CYAN
MKRVLLAFGAIAISLLVFVPSAMADVAAGARVFSANCAACHMGGGNVVNAAKTLKQSDLEQYEMASLAAIQTQVTNGKNAMPAFKGRLTAEQIENVAAYVLDQAEKGW